MKVLKNAWERQAAAFFLSQCVTLFGSQLVQMSIFWYVTLETDSGAWVAAFSICSYLPQFFFSFPGGVWADRYSRKSLILLSDSFIALCTLLMLFLIPILQPGPSLLAALLILSLLRSVGAGIQLPAVNASIAQLIPKEHLLRANSLNASMQSLVQFASPAAAGVVLFSGSLRSALALDLWTAAAGLFLLFMIPMAKPEKKQEFPSVLSDMRIGIRSAFSFPPFESPCSYTGFLFFSPFRLGIYPVFW